MAKKRKKKKSSKRFDRSDLLAILAVVISLVTLFVGMYEARIMKNQQLLIQTQQKASVWPHLAITQSISLATKDDSHFKLILKNKGVGPMKIRTSSLQLEGKPILEYKDITNLINSNLNPDKHFIGTGFSLPHDRVLSPDEELSIVEFNWEPDDAGIITEEIEQIRTYFRALEAEVQICFCNIYDDCWTKYYPDKKGNKKDGCFE